MTPAVRSHAASSRGLRYADAGVDHEKAGRSVRAILKTLTRVRDHGMGKRIGVPGGYAGFVEFGRYALGVCTDGVGTKLLVAQAMRKLDTVGIDCIAMNVNDLICHGAEPVAFVDYLGVARADAKIAREIGKGLAAGARLAGVEIVGGETAQLPEIITGFDLAGTAVGFVRRDRLITGRDISPGDVLIGLPSSGLHSNGYSLVRRVVERARARYGTRFGRSTLGRVLLEPTRIYVRPVLDLLGEVRATGLAHITGGGLRNIARLHGRRRVVIDRPLPVPAIFSWVQEHGPVAEREMYQTFNMGMGMLIVVRPRDEDRSLEILRKARLGPQVVGSVVRGRGVLHAPTGLLWERYH